MDKKNRILNAWNDKIAGEEKKVTDLVAKIVARIESKNFDLLVVEKGMPPQGRMVVSSYGILDKVFLSTVFNYLLTHYGVRVISHNSAENRMSHSGDDLTIVFTIQQEGH